MDWWEKIKKLMSGSEESSPSQPTIHEVIHRSEDFLSQYENWKEQLTKYRLIDWLNHEYALHISQPNDVDTALDFLNTPSSKGFVIHVHRTNYNKEEITFLFDYLKEKVLQLGYRTQISDTRTYNRPNWVERTDRHYLKPKPNFEETTKMNQLYGNINIQLVWRNDMAHYLKFSATHYQDHLYKEVYAFEGLMNELLK